LATLSISQRKIEDAIYFYQIILNEHPKLDARDPLVRMILLANLGVGVCSYYLGKHDAKEYIISGIKTAKEKGITFLLPALLWAYGKMINDEQKYDMAQSLFEEGLKYSKDYNLPYFAAKIIMEIGLLSLKRNDTQTALKELKEALDIAVKLNKCHLQKKIMAILMPLSTSSEKKKYSKAISKMETNLSDTYLLE
jgi:tetratricopeptide (TPR) repeat protein